MSRLGGAGHPSKAARIEALTAAELAALDRFARARLTIIDAEPIEGEMPLQDSLFE